MTNEEKAKALAEAQDLIMLVHAAEFDSFNEHLSSGAKVALSQVHDRINELTLATMSLRAARKMLGMGLDRDSNNA